jgi:hypothetical protein
MTTTQLNAMRATTRDTEVICKHLRDRDLGDIEWHIEQDGFAFVTDLGSFKRSVINVMDEAMMDEGICLRFILDLPNAHDSVSYSEKEREAWDLMESRQGKYGE